MIIFVLAATHASFAHSSFNAVFAERFLLQTLIPIYSHRDAPKWKADYLSRIGGYFEGNAIYVNNSKNLMTTNGAPKTYGRLMCSIF